MEALRRALLYGADSVSSLVQHPVCALGSGGHTLLSDIWRIAYVPVVIRSTAFWLVNFVVQRRRLHHLVRSAHKEGPSFTIVACGCRYVLRTPAAQLWRWQ